MPGDRLRLSEFAVIVGEPKETIRSIIARDEHPFEDREPFKHGAKAQRTYDGADVLAWMIFQRLREIGRPIPLAAEAVRSSDCVLQFFSLLATDEDDRLDDPDAVGIILYWADEVNTDGRTRTLPCHSFGDNRAVAEILDRGKYPKGKNANKDGWIKRGLTGLVVVPIYPIFRKCQRRCLEAGFTMVGRHLVELQ